MKRLSAVKQAETQRKAAESTVTARIPETYQWLLIPTQATPQSAVEWQATRLTGQEALAERASRKIRGDQLYTSYAGTLLRMELDRVPLWRGDHVAVKQLVEDFARYLYLPRIRDPGILLAAIRDGVSLLTWEQDSFAFAESYDEEAGRYRGLRHTQGITLADADSPGLLVRPDRARAQFAEEAAATGANPGAAEAGAPGGGAPSGASVISDGTSGEAAGDDPTQPRRFHGSVNLDSARVGRDASRIADEVIAHLAGLVGSKVRVSLEIEAEIPDGAPETVVRIVTENSRTLKFTSHGFESA